MNLLKTKYYPVDISARVIVNDPKPRERDVARKYPANIIGLPGKRLMGHSCYQSYTLKQPA